MASQGVYDVIILHGPDAREWCQYLHEVFKMCLDFQELAVNNYELDCDDPILAEAVNAFQNCKCIFILLSGYLLDSLNNNDVLESVYSFLKPPNKVVSLFCGVTDCEDLTQYFEDWSQWKHLSSEDDPEDYIRAVRDTIAEDSGCDCVTDTDTEYSTYLDLFEKGSTPELFESGNLVSIQPERIRCGIKTQMYFIFKCKLDYQIKNEVFFQPPNGTSVRQPATLVNEYILYVDAPDLPSGLVFLKVFAGDLVLCEAQICYFTDMEEISHLLENATNPVEFMCQAFKIVPYNVEKLDKLLTESLKNNIPASGLHLFGINQIEEENLSANHRDEELPTLLHFSAKYGLKNVTALLLTCPGALQAYSVSNKHGDFPNNMAEKYGHKDLRQFIDEYVETADMLKTHIEEELMLGEDGDKETYTTMADLSTGLLMKCSLNPGCDDDLYETMVGLVPSYEADCTYVDMTQYKDTNLSAAGKHCFTAKDSVLRKILEGGSIDESYNNEEDPYDVYKGEDVYDTVRESTSQSEAVNRPPIPVPRPKESQDTEPFISKVFTEKTQTRQENIYVDSLHKPRRGSSVKLRRDRPQSSVYDPFVGMKTPGQRELITLQERVKLGIITVDEALLQFKEWQLNQKKRSDSFRYQQENLKRLRDSINRRQNENKKHGKKADLEITKPIRRGQNPGNKTECGIYESSACFSAPPKKEITRGNWKTDSTSSTASSASNRSSTRSTVSLSSGMEADSEDNEESETSRRQSPRNSVREDRPPPRPPRIPNRESSRLPPAVSRRSIGKAPPIPPRGR
ncbi:phosphoinositide 3-kinase adapter protein 1 [Bombina bombina]|uniref:phosphoinositide 3-kinase adapter protein 1 n=1 Tax=Bombina bombina TaxID=8345 RepID=UPI00235A5DB6|nr:phosphoinositide 3-kinase adapter protein 1 [Bombina bombina]